MLLLNYAHHRAYVEQQTGKVGINVVIKLIMHLTEHAQQTGEVCVNVVIKLSTSQSMRRAANR